VAAACYVEHCHIKRDHEISKERCKRDHGTPPSARASTTAHGGGEVAAACFVEHCKRDHEISKEICKRDHGTPQETRKRDLQKRPAKKTKGLWASASCGVEHRKRVHETSKETCKRDHETSKETRKKDLQKIPFACGS